MKIDEVSSHLIQAALYLDNKVPGIVSEIWLDKDEKELLKSQITSDLDIQALLDETRVLIEQVSDTRRKRYLSEVLESLQFQIDNFSNKEISFDDFTKQAYGFEIKRITENEILEIETEIKNLESKIGLSRQDVFLKHKLEPEEYKSQFESFVTTVKKVLPDYITNFSDNGFEFEVTTNEPWSAFNSHIAPFRSRLTLNSDISFTKLDLYRLAFHEAYGGHHSELSQKDKLMIDQGRGEHGLVITFSPQTFISEAIAEGIFVLLGGLDKKNDEQMMGWYYDRLIFALQNVATFWFFDDHLSKENINESLKKYVISDETRNGILSFSTDPLFGKYAPVYYTAFNFLNELYSQTSNKEKLIKTLFTQPCTPKLLTEEFGN